MWMGRHYPSLWHAVSGKKVCLVYIHERPDGRTDCQNTSAYPMLMCSYTDNGAGVDTVGWMGFGFDLEATSQPSGKRIADFVGWVKERGALYANWFSSMLLDGLRLWKSSSLFSCSTNEMGLVFKTYWASVYQAKYSRGTKVNGLCLNEQETNNYLLNSGVKMEAERRIGEF